MLNNSSKSKMFFYKKPNTNTNKSENAKRPDFRVYEDKETV